MALSSKTDQLYFVYNYCIDKPVTLNKSWNWNNQTGQLLYDIYIYTYYFSFYQFNFSNIYF